MPIGNPAHVPATRSVAWHYRRRDRDDPLSGPAARRETLRMLLPLWCRCASPEDHTHTVDYLTLPDQDLQRCTALTR
jgi:hypothetical protein